MEIALPSEVQTMNTNNGANGNGRIEFLKQKEREIRARIAAEQVRQQKMKAPAVGQ
jgi:hypothetical protein